MEKEKGSVKTCRKIEHGFVKAEDVFLAVALLVLTASIIIQIVCRYVLKISSPWCEELARYLFVTMTYIGSGRAFINGAHINIDLMDTLIDKKAKDPVKTQKNFNFFSMLLTLLFTSMFGIFYFQYLRSMARHPQTSASMHISMMIPMSLLLLGVILMVYHSVCRLFYTYDAPQAPQAEE
jgi:TRAP-type C4-dicarboxylate transport system permease small subunit